MLTQDVVVLCHGFGDYRDGFVLPQLAEALARRGLGSLRIDLPGCGESEGTFRYANMRDEVCRSLGSAQVGMHHSLLGREHSYVCAAGVVRQQVSMSIL